MMKSKEKKFLRKCVGCGEYKNKSDLIKITSEYRTGDVKINPTSDIFGRSCYICKNKDCVDLAFKKMKISKIFKRNIDSSQKEKINTILES